MPNKQVRHTELDAALASRLLDYKVETKVEWSEIETLLPEKSTVIKGPLAGVGFSLSSFAGIFAVKPLVEQATLFAKKWSMALYIVAGTLIVATAFYFMYNSFPKNSSPKEVIAAPEVIQKEIQPATPQAAIKNDSVVPVGTTAIGTLPETPAPVENKIENNLPVEVKAEASNLPAKTDLNEANKVSATEPVQLRTNDTSKDSDFGFVPATSDSSADKKGKVLYYKESLSMDKLEQLSGDKNGSSTKGSENKQDTLKRGGLFKKLRKH